MYNYSYTVLAVVLHNICLLCCLADLAFKLYELWLLFYIDSYCKEIGVWT